MGCAGSSAEQTRAPIGSSSEEQEERVQTFYGTARSQSGLDSKCIQGCGRFRYGKFDTCCSRCSGPDGPHSEDCGKKGLCSEGCGRRAFVDAEGKVFKTCCKSCAFLHQNKGFFGHDIACDVRDNEGTAPPFYWKSNKKTEEDFHDEVGGEYVKKMGAKLLQKTLPNCEVVQCLRIEDSKLWHKYTDRRRDIRQRAVAIEDIKPETSENIEFSANTTLDHMVNEVWLFHGTSLDAAKAIAKSNFRLPSSAGNFGKGLYFAEASVKSDQYAGKIVTEGDHYGCKIMLLCRVTLGNVRHIDGTDRRAERLVEDPNFDSVVGIAAAKLREFLVYDVAQVYPEYVLYYKKG